MYEGIVRTPGLRLEVGSQKHLFTSSSGLVEMQPDQRQPHDAVEHGAATGEACVPQSEAPAGDDASEADDAGRIWNNHTFSTVRPKWSSVVGSWSVGDRSFVQSNPDGCDLSAVAGPIPEPARVAVDIIARGEGLGGGLMIDQPTPMLRNGIVVIGFTDDDRSLHWGPNDNASGAYAYPGGVSMSADAHGCRRSR